jgi:hypothetical protein
MFWLAPLFIILAMFLSVTYIILKDIINTSNKNRYFIDTDNHLKNALDELLIKVSQNKNTSFQLQEKASKIRNYYSK